jgi:phosphoribosylformylglycinamidine cyclo-ligase
MAVGRVALDRVLMGQDVAEGDAVIGVTSNGIHSNGLSLARRTFFETGGYKVGHRFDELDCGIGEELLKPTHIYVPEAMEILDTVPGVKALINITSDGLLNLVRVGAQVGFVIDNLIEPPPIFPLIQKLANVDEPEMFEVFNRGIGFCYVVAPDAVDTTLEILRKHGRTAQRIGYATADPKKKVAIPQRGLVGQGKKFRKV